MSEPRSGQRAAAPTLGPRFVASLLAFAGARLALAPAAMAAGAEGYRGIPAFVQVASIEVASSARANQARVCYRFSSTLPAITLKADAAERFARSVAPAGAPSREAPSAPLAAAAPPPMAAAPSSRLERGRRRPARAGDLRVVFDSTFQRVEPAQLTFFSSIPRFSMSGAPRTVALASRRSEPLEYPAFEQVDFCETTEFEKALGPELIQALFESPFMIGDLTGTVAFRLELVEMTSGHPPAPGHDARPRWVARGCSGAAAGSQRPAPAQRAAGRRCRERTLSVLSLSPAQHVVPVFGKNADLAAERLTIEAAAAANAALFMDSGMPRELVASEGDPGLNAALLATIGVVPARPSAGQDCHRFLGVLRDAVVARRASKPRAASEPSPTPPEPAASTAEASR
jgi:hypothetical protein